MNYDLEERTAKFGENIIRFAKTFKSDEFTKPPLGQIIRSATSVGANYMEANQASSKKDFRNKIKISQKEANETKHWLRMIAVSCEDKKDECRKYWQESHELTLILAKISRSCE